MRRLRRAGGTGGPGSAGGAGGAGSSWLRGRSRNSVWWRRNWSRARWLSGWLARLNGTRAGRSWLGDWLRSRWRRLRHWLRSGRSWLRNWWRNNSHRLAWDRAGDRRWDGTDRLARLRHWRWNHDRWFRGDRNDARGDHSGLVALRGGLDRLRQSGCARRLADGRAWDARWHAWLNRRYRRLGPGLRWWRWRWDGMAPAVALWWWRWWGFRPAWRRRRP